MSWFGFKARARNGQILLDRVAPLYRRGRERSGEMAFRVLIGWRGGATDRDPREAGLGAPRPSDGGGGAGAEGRCAPRDARSGKWDFYLATKPRGRVSVERVRCRPVGWWRLPVGTCGFGVGVTSRCCVERVQERTEGRGFARGFRPSVPNPAAASLVS